MNNYIKFMNLFVRVGNSVEFTHFKYMMSDGPLRLYLKLEDEKLVHLGDVCNNDPKIAKMICHTISSNFIEFLRNKGPWVFDLDDFLYPRYVDKDLTSPNSSQDNESSP